MPNVDSGMAIVASLGINVLGNAGMPAKASQNAWNCLECWNAGMPGMLECQN